MYPPGLPCVTVKAKIRGGRDRSGKLPSVSEEGIVTFEPKWILDIRWIKVGHQTVQETLVHWHGLNADDATWERPTDLELQFPNLKLEDMLRLQGEGNVVSQAIVGIGCWEELASENTCG